MYEIYDEIEAPETGAFEEGLEAAANQPTLDCVDFMAQQGGR